jgi:hypothetical protein
MPAPPHIASFRKFVAHAPDDHLRVSVTFGLFMQSEQYWINERNNEPDARACCRYHEDFLNDYHIQQLLDKATEHLNEFSNAVEGEKRAE